MSVAHRLGFALGLNYACTLGSRCIGHIWEFPKIKGTLFWDPYKDPTISGTILGSPIFGNSHIGLENEPILTHALHFSRRCALDKHDQLGLGPR